MGHRRSASHCALILLVLLGLAESPADATARGGEAPGSSASENLDLARWKGRVILLDFWASWCGPCRESFPWMAGMVARHESEGLVVVTVNLDQDREAADRFLEGRRFDFESVYDPEGRLAERWGVESMPFSILFDRDGKEAFRHLGFRQEEVPAYEEHVRTLLAAKGGTGAGRAPAGDRVERESGRRMGAQPWERACLARAAMRFDGAPVDLSFDDHIYFSREASSGGRGFGGGGCGCN